jgi:hypothetical protein
VPLRALVEDREVIAPLLDDEAYADLRAELRRHVVAARLPCCAGEAFLRTSKLGTRHFVHRVTRDCDHSGETLAHLWAKAEVIAGCKSIDWDARPEVTGEGWRADVLASRGQTQIAFEVQWSPQDEELALARQDRYRRDGIRGCWLYRGAVGRARRELPMFALKSGGGQAVVAHAGREYAVREFVKLLLQGRVRFLTALRTRARVNFIEMDCWRCHKPAHIYFVEQRTLCGHVVSEDLDSFDEDVRQQVAIWLVGEGRGQVSLGAIKRRYSRTVGRHYLSFGCPRCDALFGDFFVGDATLEAHIFPEQVVTSFDFDRTCVERAHWCLPADGRYCDAGQGTTS